LEDVSRIRDDLEKFYQIQNKLEQRDLNKYSYVDLMNLVDKHFNIELDTNSDTDLGDDVEVLYNGPLGLLVSPKTKEASCRLGSGTRWCTAAKKNNEFGYYNKQGPLYIWKDKSGAKYQFHFESGQFMNAQDQNIPRELLMQWRETHPVISKLFKKYEKEIIDSRNALTIFQYARYVIKDRWPEAEPIMMKDAYDAYLYAEMVIKRRWPEAEPIIMQELEHAYQYARDVIKGRWLEAEPYIMKNPKWAFWYAHDVIKGRWLEAEPYIMKNPKWAYWYARHAIEDRWPDAEKYIMKDAESAYKYARYVIKGRWLEAEPTIANEESWWDDYKNFFELK